MPSDAPPFGTVEIKLEVGPDLPAPGVERMADCVDLVFLSGGGVFVFAVLHPLTQHPARLFTVHMPTPGLRLLAEGIARIKDAALQTSGRAILEVPPMSEAPISESFFAAFAYVVVNEFGISADFYQLVPRDFDDFAAERRGASGQPRPVLRVLLLPGRLNHLFGKLEAASRL